MFSKYESLSLSLSLTLLNNKILREKGFLEEWNPGSKAISPHVTAMIEVSLFEEAADLKGR